MKGAAVPPASKAAAGPVPVLVAFSAGWEPAVIARTPRPVLDWPYSPAPELLSPFRPGPPPELSPARAGASGLALRPTIPFEFAPVPALETSSIAFVAVPFSSLVASTVFVWPRLKTPPMPLPASAAVAARSTPAPSPPIKAPLKKVGLISPAPFACGGPRHRQAAR